MINYECINKSKVISWINIPRILSEGFKERFKQTYKIIPSYSCIEGHTTRSPHKRGGQTQWPGTSC